eukprot:scaffold25830_cov162-Cylindrotheca_fusiformis.AAC.14
MTQNATVQATKWCCPVKQSMGLSRISRRGIKLISCLLLCRQESFAFTSSSQIQTRLHLTSFPQSIAVPTRRRFPSPLLKATSVADRVGVFLTRDPKKRPRWAPDWMPTWLWNLRPPVQLAVLLLSYLLHITVLCQNSIPLPVQLVPNERGHFQTIGLDTLMGIASLGVYQYIRRLQAKTEENLDDTSDVKYSSAANESSTEPIPSLLSTPTLEESPWKNVYKSKFSRLSSFLAICALFQAYLWTGRFSVWWEDTFYYLANFYPMTVAAHRSLCVLFGHLSWIAIGFAILRSIPRPQSLFRSKWYSQKFNDSQWLWWTIGGYFISSWFFNMADFVNQWVLPLPILEQAQDSIVTQLISPEFNDWFASVVGYIAPCITAPWWEEVLCRGFLLPALTLQMKYKWAVFWNGVIFAAQHMSSAAFIPLAVFGWTWSVLYAKSGNLLTTILVHTLWNSRVFLGSWLGL